MSRSVIDVEVEHKPTEVISADLWIMKSEIRFCLCSCKGVQRGWTIYASNSLLEAPP